MTAATATITLTIPDQFCIDLLTTAVEGGSAYWLACRRVVRRKDDSYVTKIVGCEDREDETTKWGDADIGTIQLGIQRIVDGTVKVRSDIRKAVLEAIVDEDSTSWDADTADCVLQAGLLGDIVYG